VYLILIGPTQIDGGNSHTETIAQRSVHDGCAEIQIQRYNDFIRRYLRA
jgi:hypothetical protein